MNRVVKEVKATDTPSHTPPGAEGWKDVLQVLKEQSAKMEKLARALSVIQQGMLRNNPGDVKDNVNEASEVLSGMLNTHKCLLESGVEIQKKLESHPASKKMGIFRRLRSASLGDTLKKLTKGRRDLPPPLQGSAPQEREGRHIAIVRLGHQRPGPTKGWGMAAVQKEKTEKKRKRRKRFLYLLRRNLKQRGGCRGALRLPGRVTLSWCPRRTTSPTPKS